MERGQIMPEVETPALETHVHFRARLADDMRRNY